MDNIELDFQHYYFDCLDDYFMGTKTAQQVSDKLCHFIRITRNRAVLRLMKINCESLSKRPECWELYQTLKNDLGLKTDFKNGHTKLIPKKPRKKRDTLRIKTV
jgi:hypothetical protein